jgi:hypothetical protein
MIQILEVVMQDLYYDSSVEFLQGSLETIGENLAYGFFSINNLIKETLLHKYHKYLFSVFFKQYGLS